MNTYDAPVLSIRQPWAWLIVNGYKDIENRSWSTHVRGRVLIHASKRMETDAYGIIRQIAPEIELPTLDTWAGLRGGIVGEANLVDCVTESDSRWFFGDYGFVLKDARPLPFKPCLGQLGFFRVRISA